jgi:hypothetical protein
MRASQPIRFVGLLCTATWLSVTASRATIIGGGNVINQTWNPAGNPYIVQGDVTVPGGAFLLINAGTIVQFASTDGQAAGSDTSRVELIVNGTLTVAGTSASPVTFQAQSGTGTAIWYGIEPSSAATSVSIDHAVIRNASFGIRSSVLGNTLSVTNTTIDTCTYGVLSSTGNPVLDAVRVSNGTYGFYLAGEGTVTIRNGISQGGAYGVFVFAQSGTLNLSIVNSTLNGSSDYGMYVGTISTLFQANVTAQNLIVTNNGTGILREFGGGPVAVTVTYSDVWNNGTNYFGVMPGAGTISVNPAYVSATNFHLLAGSPAIDAGNSGADVPTHDFDGNGVGGAAYDMGAYEFVPGPALGSVPEVNGGPQPVLRISTPDHISLNLQWGAACGGAATDYAIYEGAIGSWYSHVPGLCTTSGNLTAVYSPAPGNRYYLVVPLNASAEGIYGHATSGSPIPVSVSACRTSQDTAGCP